MKYIKDKLFYAITLIISLILWAISIVTSIWMIELGDCLKCIPCN
jgi:hypothetical protein